MRLAGFWFTLWAQWTAIHMTADEFYPWLESKGYRLGRDLQIYKYLPEWWYSVGGGRGTSNSEGEQT